MATNVFAGRVGDLLVATASSLSTAAATVGKLRNFEVSVTADTIDATNFGSSGWGENIDGIKRWTVTAEALWASTAFTSQQDNLRTALSSGVRQWFKIRNSTGTGSQTFQGWGYVNSWTLAAGVEDIQLHNFGITGDGALTES